MREFWLNLIFPGLSKARSERESAAAGFDAYQRRKEGRLQRLLKSLRDGTISEG